MSAEDRGMVDRQRAFYEGGVHPQLRVQEHDRYARKLAGRLAEEVGLEPGRRILEAGAGFGRFSFPLLDRGLSLVAVDVSGRMLAELERVREQRGIAPERCRTLCSDVDLLTPEQVGGPVDFVVGFFFLHHVPDLARTVAGLARLLAPGGAMAFVEPNRRNPLFLAQVLCCPEMGWREERGAFLISDGKVRRAMAAAGLSVRPTRRFGFFPPQVHNRFASSRRLEERLERFGPIGGVLPFLLLSAGADDR